MIRWVEENPGKFFAGVVAACVAMMGAVLLVDQIARVIFG